MCVCYSQPLRDKPELTYTVVLVHKGAQGGVESAQTADESLWFQPLYSLSFL